MCDDIILEHPGVIPDDVVQLLNDEADDMTEQGSPPKMRANLRQLAEYLGLSETTVSRVVNQSPGAGRISQKTRERVTEAAAKLNYSPSALARSLRSKRTMIVSVIVPEISDGYSTSVLSGIQDALLEAGYFYFVVSHRHRAELLRDYPALLVSRGVEGIIAVDSPIENDVSIPIVSVSGHSRHASNVNIELDHLLAARYSLEHLKRLGHTRIAFIKGQEFSSDTQPRWRAIVKTAAELDIEICPKLTVQLDEDGLGFEGGRAATVRLLQEAEPFTAIFAFNDHSAIGAMMALRDAGISVPSQISVIGFDDIPIAAIHSPALTTVRQPLQEMGRAAAIELLKILRSEPAKKTMHTIHVLPTFIERQSTATAPPRVTGEKQADPARKRGT